MADVFHDVSSWADSPNRQPFLRNITSGKLPNRSCWPVHTIVLD